MKKSEPFHIYFNLELFIVHTMFIECNEVKCIVIFLEIILQNICYTNCSFKIFIANNKANTTSYDKFIAY